MCLYPRPQDTQRPFSHALQCYRSYTKPCSEWETLKPFPSQISIPSATMFHSVPRSPLSCTPVLLLSVLFCIYCLYEKVSRAVHKALVSLSPFGFVLWHWGRIPGPHVSSTAALAQNRTSALSMDSNSPSSVKLVFQ